MTHVKTENQPSDAEVVRLVRDGNTREFNVLVDRHLPALVGFFRYLGVPGGMIEDLLQETFMRAFEKIKLYDPAKSFPTWLTVVGRNIFYNQIRRKDDGSVEKSEQKTFSDSGEDEIITRATVRELLDSLDEMGKFLVELRVFRDLSFAEISEITGEPEATLRVRFHRTIGRLRLKAREANL